MELFFTMAKVVATLLLLLYLLKLVLKSPAPKQPCDSCEHLVQKSGTSVKCDHSGTSWDVKHLDYCKYYQPVHSDRKD